MRRRLAGWPAQLAPHLVFLIPELLMAAGPFVIQTVARAGERPRFRMPDFFYGGQALIEGVMMRGRTTVAMSVRPPSGEIVTLSEPLPEALRSGRLIKVPFIRGMFVLYETLILGTRMLMRSAAIAAEGDDIEIGRGAMIGTMIFSVGMAVGIFFVLPLFLSTFAEGVTESDLLANLVEGVIRLVVFIAYISLIGTMGEIKRVFAYHGAEHKAISAHEARRPLTPEEVDRFSTAHTRCGTTFLLIVVVISIFFFGLIPREGVPICGPLPVADRPGAGHRRLQLRARPFRREPLRESTGACHLPAGPLAAVAHHAPAGPQHAGGEHRVAGVVPGFRSADRRPPR